MDNRALWDEVEKVKDFHGRNFSQLTSNFYVMRAALRYFCVKKGRIITSVDVSENFPIAVSVAGSCLKALDELDVVQQRRESSSKRRYQPQKVDLDRLDQLGEVLRESHEINDFNP